MNRWVLVRDDTVRGYLFAEATEPTDAEKRRLCFGDATDERDLEPEGEWHAVPAEAGLVGDGWRYEGGVFLPPL